MRWQAGYRAVTLVITTLLITSGLALAQEATPMATPLSDDPIANLPLEVKVGQMIIAGVTGTTADDDAEHIVRDLHIGNIILMGRNFESPDQVLKLTQGLQTMALDANGIPLIIGTDDEGGLVQRANYYAGFTPMPPAELAGAAEDSVLMERYGHMVGVELAAVGVNLDFAPVLDVNDNPDNPVIGALGRSFGVTPELVELSALPFFAGLESAGVIAVGKHFPGHGSTTTDSHLDLPYVDKSLADLEAVDIAPFAAAVEAGIPAIMPAHVVYTALDPDLPATLSSKIQTGLLRETLGFDGMIVTDDLGMAGIMQIAPPEHSGPRAVLAGADMLTCVRMTTDGACQPEMIDQLHAGLVAAVKDGTISEKRIDESVRRILALKASYGITGPVTGENLDLIQSPDHLRIIAEIYAAVADRKEANP